MKKILLLTLEYPPQYGGVAQYLEGEVKASSVPVVVSHVLGPRWFFLIWRERKKFKGCDYLWISHVLPIGYIALVWKWMYITPYRVYVHGLDLVRPLQSRWKKFWVKMILHNADEIVVNSNATAGLLSKYGLNPSQARVQYPRVQSVEVERHGDMGKELRDKYGIGDKPLLLTISRLVKRKGIDLVLHALLEVWKQIPNLVYVVVGEGEDKERLEGMQKNDRIIFGGSVSDEAKYGWLSACDCFILTPVDDPNDFEGYGIVYKEAQMFGKPVIGSRVGGVPEAVGDDGILVEVGNINQIAEAIVKYVKS